MKQLLAGAFGDDLTRGKDVVAGGHLEDRADFLLNEEKGDSQIPDLDDLLKYVSRKMGASPVEGSSMHISLGRDIKALPMASICCSPPERVPEIWLDRFWSTGNN